jgi:hypothetical protein
MMDRNWNANCSVTPSLHGRAVLRLHNLALSPLYNDVTYDTVTDSHYCIRKS